MQQARQKIRESSGETVKTPLLQQGIIAKIPQKTIIENRPSIEANEEVDDGDEEEEFFYEDDDEENQGQEDVKATPKPKDEPKPVILTSNFFLPGKPIPKLEQHDFETQEPNDLSSDISEVNAEQKDKAEDVIDSVAEVETEKILETTTAKKIIEEKKTKPSTPIQPKPVVEDPNVEYEYEYDYIDEPITTTTKAVTEEKVIPKPITVQVDQTTVKITDDNDHNANDDDEDDEQQTTIESDDVPEVTIRTEEKTSKPIEKVENNIKVVETTPAAAVENKTSTDGYVVVGSVQTSRSISDARYITFPQVIPEEKRQSLSDLGKDVKNFNKDEDYSNNTNENASDESNKDDDLITSNEENTTTEEIDSTEENFPQSQNESDAHQDIVKNRVHKLSSISEKLAHLHELNEPKPEITTKSVPVVIRKFTPRTTKAPTRKLTSTTAPSKRPNVEVDDELASLLPPGFKYRAHSLSESTSKATTTESESTSTTAKSETTKEEITAKKIQFKEISLEDLLPKDYKPPSESKPKAQDDTKNTSDILSKIKFDDNIEALLPKDYKPSSTTPSSITKAPFRLSTVTEDISKFLPPGYKQPKESITTKRPLPKTTMDDISKFLPPGYKLPKSTTTEKPTSANDNNSNSDGDGSSIDSVLNKLSFNTDISSLLPPGFKANASADDSASNENKDDKSSQSTSISTSTLSSASNNKFVFPKGIGKRPGVRLTTPRPSNAGPPTPPKVTIRNGLPTRYYKFFVHLLSFH